MEMGDDSLWGKGLTVNGCVDIPVILTPGSVSPEYPVGAGGLNIPESSCGAFSIQPIIIQAIFSRRTTKT